jgi:hypothetical protein
MILRVKVREEQLIRKTGLTNCHSLNGEVPECPAVFSGGDT